MQPSDEEVELRLQARAQCAAVRERRIEQGREFKRNAKVKADRAKGAAEVVISNRRNPTNPTPEKPTAPPHSSVYVNSPAAVRGLTQHVQASITTAQNPRPQRKTPHELKLQAESYRNTLLAERARTGVPIDREPDHPFSGRTAAGASTSAAGEADKAEVAESGVRRGFWRHLVRQDQTEAELLANLTTSYSEALTGGMFTVGLTSALAGLVCVDTCVLQDRVLRGLVRGIRLCWGARECATDGLL